MLWDIYLLTHRFVARGLKTFLLSKMLINRSQSLLLSHGLEPIPMTRKPAEPSPNLLGLSPSSPSKPNETKKISPSSNSILLIIPSQPAYDRTDSRILIQPLQPLFLSLEFQHSPYNLDLLGCLYYCAEYVSIFELKPRTSDPPRLSQN